MASVFHHHGGAGWRNARHASTGKGRNWSDNPMQLWPIAIHMGEKHLEVIGEEIS